MLKSLASCRWELCWDRISFTRPPLPSSPALRWRKRGCGYSTARESLPFGPRTAPDGGGLPSGCTDHQAVPWTSFCRHTRTGESTDGIGQVHVSEGDCGAQGRPADEIRPGHGGVRHVGAAGKGHAHHCAHLDALGCYSRCNLYVINLEMVPWGLRLVSFVWLIDWLTEFVSLIFLFHFP